MKKMIALIFLTACGQSYQVQVGRPYDLCQARACTSVNGTITISKEDQNNCQIISHEIAKFEAYEEQGEPDSFLMTEPKGCL